MASRTDLKLDAVVVGGGVIGLACAWRMARSGAHVRVLERDRPGAGASGIAAGMLAPVGEVRWGEDALRDLALEAHAGWPAFAAELAAVTGLEPGYRGLGALHLALDRDEAAELRRRFELMESLGLEAAPVRPSECRRLEPGLAPGVTAGVHAPHEAAVEPARIVAALAAACEADGVELVSDTEVDGLLVEGDRARGVRDAGGGEHRAATVVLAAGAWAAAAWVPQDLRVPVRPVKGQLVELRGPAAEPLCERIVVTERVYVVPRAEGRLAVGATVEEQGFDGRVTAGGVFELLREAYRVLPDVAELELLGATAGFRPTTPDNAPVIGPAPLDGLLLAAGHFRNGVLLAPVTAAAIAALAAGEEPPLATSLTPFAAERFGSVEAPR